MGLAPGLGAEAEILRRTDGVEPVRRRMAAVVALVVGAATAVLAVAVAVSQFPRGLGVLACVVIAAAAAWFGVLRRGILRVVGLGVAALALAGVVVLIVA